MTSKSLCAACRQVYRLQCGRFGHSRESYGARTTSFSIHNIPRLFSTSRLLSASQATPKESQAIPGEYQPKPPPTNPKIRDEPDGAPSEGREVGASSISIAKEIRKRYTGVTETYVAYGVCENLVKECARQADYTIPQAHEKKVEIPKTKDQEDLGVGTGWWFESERIWLPCSPPLTTGLTFSFSSWSHADLQYLGPNNLPAHVPAHLPPTLFPSRQCSNMASTSHQPFLLHRRGPDGHHPQHRRTIYTQQIPERLVPAVARATGGLRRGTYKGRRSASNSSMEEHFQGG